MSNDAARRINVIPCAAGWFAVFRDDQGTLFVGEQIIAWRIITFVDHKYKTGEEFDAIEIDAIACDGCPSEESGFFGYLRPDGKVECPYDCIFRSLDEARAARECAA